MLSLLYNGQVLVFGIILVAIIFSLTLHEYGHARSAKMLSDDTAEKMGRLTLNPAAHVDPLGLLMVVLVGFGYAKPVPISPNKMKQPWAGAAVAAAGPLMNLLLAILSVNLLLWGLKTGAFTFSDPPALALTILSQINLLLMLFNLIPMGPLDGHYIMSWLLPPRLSSQYDYFNSRYGSLVFIGLILLSVLGVPIFHFLMSFSAALIPYISFV